MLQRIQREPIKNKNEETALGPRKTLCQIVRYILKLINVLAKYYSHLFRKKKPGAGIGWTEPRKESVIGRVATEF